MGLLDGFEAMSLVPKKGDSILSVSKSIIRFNKATAAELGYPDNVKLLVNVKNITSSCASLLREGSISNQILQ